MTEGTIPRYSGLVSPPSSQEVHHTGGSVLLGGQIKCCLFMLTERCHSDF